MNKKIILLFSHQLTSEQLDELKEKWAVTQTLPLPKELQTLWSNIPPELESLHSYLDPIKEFVKEHSFHGDLVLVQGDFGACYELVNFCKNLELISVYATTDRKVIEYKNKEGKMEKKSIFEFRRFRKYEENI